MSEEKVIHLKEAARPTATEECRQEAIAILKHALELAENGEVSECLVILKMPGDDVWIDKASSTMKFSEWIGKLEIVKHSWLQIEDRQDDECA